MRIFPGAEAATIDGVAQVRSSQNTVLADVTLASQEQVYIGNVQANSLNLQQSKLTVYGDLNISTGLVQDYSNLKVTGIINVGGDMLVQNTQVAPVAIADTGTFGTAGTPDSIRSYKFSLTETADVVIRGRSNNQSIFTALLFRDDGVLDIEDHITNVYTWNVNSWAEINRNLEPGDYIVVIGRLMVMPPQDEMLLLQVLHLMGIQTTKFQ